ncbi:hypothetical protein F5144DRAFT_550976 [Chaetomium tenue]|uniref:Uncharacterized protein n=1 Tax=Chaetomium tenue TaxID=1854479 RepID=A0ACB7NYH5_9PEZI|nr:hypothetical protein F5144DRAFT_550976 [Chaetomium globosum]
MCFQLIELYNLCGCLYYQHAVDRCAAYGRRNHEISRRTIRVGYMCKDHGDSAAAHGAPVGFASFEGSKRPEPRRRDGRRLTAPGGGPKGDRSAPTLMQPATLPVATAPETYEKFKQPNALDLPEGGDFKRVPSDQDDSDSSCDSDGESAVSVASSATTIGGDTVGLLFSKLLYFGDLRFLWPQLIARSATWKRSQRTIERLLRRYSDDLHALAVNEPSNETVTRDERALRIRAARFVRRSRTNIAQRLCEAHYDFSEQRSAEKDNERSGEQDGGYAPAAEHSDSSPEDDSLFIPEAAEEFLFRTEPILSLQASVKALVRVRAPQTSAFGAGIWKSSKLWFENTMTRVWRTELKPENSTRLHWTCLRPGALADLQSLLQCYGKDTIVDSDMEIFDVENTQEQPKDWKQTFSQAVSGLTRRVAAGKKGTNLPRYSPEKKKEVIPIGACSRTGTDGSGVHDFVLLCIPFMRVATKLYQPEICRINSDQEFFQLLRHYYASKRGPSPWKWLRRVKSINFVKFELYRSHLTDIRLTPSLPPPSRIGTEYAFDSTTPITTNPRTTTPPLDDPDLTTLPPIGPNHLTHLFTHPTHADVLPTIWRRIPRKLHTELAVCPTRGTGLGWGLHLGEGTEWGTVLGLGGVVFVGCLVVAVVWTVTMC